MSEPNNTLGVGQDKTPPPAWDPEALQTWPAIVGAVDDMVHNQGDANSHTDLTNNLMSHMWYQLQDDFAEATRTLGRVLEDFQREYTGLKDFAGEAADSFREFAKSIYQGGEDVYNTLTTRDFATTFGNIGHDIQSFSNTFWDFVQQAHDYEKQLAEHYANAINMAEYGEEVDALTVQAQDAYNRQEIELYKSLRNLLADWRDRFADRGNELDTLNVALPPGATDSGGRTGKSGLRDAGGENQEWRKENAEDGRTGKNGLRDASGENQEWRKENAEDGRTGKNGLRDAGGENQEWRKENAAADANSGLQQQMAAGVGDLTKEPVQTASQPGDEQGLDATEGLGVPDTSGAVAPGGGSEPTRPAEPRQLRKLAQMTPAQRAAGEAGSGGGSGAGDEGASAADAAEQERQQGLADAKDAANGALAPLSGSGSGAPGSGTGGGGLPSGSGDKVKIPASLSSAPADDAGGSAGSDSGSAAADEAERQRQADEAERQKGLADAKDAANGALAPLSSAGSGAPGSGTAGGGSAGKSKIPASLSSAPADDKSGSGSGAGDGGSAAADEAERQRQADEAERQKGLADAKDAANGALAPLSGSGSNAPGSDTGGGASPGGSGDKVKIPDSLTSSPDDTGGSDSGTGDPGAGGGAGIGGGVDDPAEQQRQEGLQEARDAANKAISGLQGTGSGADTGTGDSSSGADDSRQGSSGDIGAPPDTQKFKVPDSLTGAPADTGTGAGGTSGGGSSDGGTPDAAEQQRQQALQEAKDAANRALDGLASDPSQPGSGEPRSSLNDFLSGQSPDAGSGQDGDSPIADKAHQDAKAAIDKAIESLPGYNGNDAYAQALHDAKQQADEAIDGLSANSDSRSPGGQHPVKLESAPPSGGGLDSGTGGGVSGSVGSGGVGGGDLPAHNTLDGAGTPRADSVLDTDVAARQGLAPATGAVTQQAPVGTTGPGSAIPADHMGGAGMPMGGMGGGMGGMGQNENRERQPNTWLQDDGGAWRDEHEDEDVPSSVLGRNS